MDPQRVQELFLRMVDLPEDQRSIALEQACGSEFELKKQVERLLQAHEGLDSFLDREDEFEQTVESGDGKEGAGGEGGPNHPDRALRSNYEMTTEFGTAVKAGAELGGRYRLQEIIGEGGMGEVWVAKQSAPVRRKVAIKLIKPGMDSRAVLNRFEQERQALAMMDHPNIARVLDGGMSATGQPYFVMELVNGLPLTKFCDQAMLPPRARLELFVSVCHAVQHAHQKGIVHRDLKPANILVTVIDGKPIPKVIDFGVAKAVGGKLTEESMSTQFGAVVGTLEYMSPEQAGYSGIDVDTRADIYSLGVILYELLTGLRPLDAVRLKQSAFSEMIRIIQEEEPSKPSTRLSTDASLPSASALRQMDPKKLMALLRGELDWVVMKCLEKQRDRRYETVNALARDVLSYLANEPVEARPPSTAYRARKFLARHRLPVTAAAVVMLSLVLGIIGTTWGWREAQRQREIADERRDEANDARMAERERAEGERKARMEANERRLEAEQQSRLAEDRLREVEVAQQKAEQEKAIAEAVRDFLKYKLLSQADVENQANALLSSGGRVADAKVDPTIRELLDRAAAELGEETINESFPNQPLVQAEILQTVGGSYVGVGAFQQAIPFLERSLAIRQTQLGREVQPTVSSMNSLAIAELNAGHIQRAVSLFEESLQLSKTHFPQDTKWLIQVTSNLGGAYQCAGKLDEGLELAKEAQRLREATLAADDPGIVVGMAGLGASYNDARQHERALEIFTRVLPKLQEILGPDHPMTLYCMNNLSTCYGALNRFDESLAVQQEACQLVVSKLGSEHPISLKSQTNLAGAQLAVGNWSGANDLLESVIDVASARFGRSHPLAQQAIVGLADVHMQNGNLDRAVALQSEALASYQQTFGPDHPDTIVIESNLAAIYARMMQPNKSLPIFQKVLEKRKSIYGPEHPLTMLALEDVGANYVALGKTDEGRAMLEEAFAHAADEPELLDVVLRLTMLDFASGQGEAGLRRLENALPQYESLRGPDHRATLKCLSWMATSHFKLGQFDEATSMFEALLPRQTALLGPNDPDTVETLRNLAANYRVKGRLPESLEMFRQVLERSAASHSYDLPKHMGAALGVFASQMRAGDTDYALDLADIILATSTPAAVADATGFANFVAAVASVYVQNGKRQKAIEALDQGINLLEQLEVPLGPGTLKLVDLLGATCWQNGEFDKAIGAYLSALDAREKRLGRNAPETVRTIANLGTNYKDSGRLDQALPLLEEAYQASLDQPNVRWVGFTLLDAYSETDRIESAKTLASELLQYTQSEFDTQEPKRCEQTAAIALALLKLKLFSEAEPVARELLAIREQTQPESWSTFHSMSLLGGALLGQERFAEAENLLLKGFEGMQARQDSIPAAGKRRLVEALSRLVQLYTATNQLETARSFREKMAEFEGVEAPDE